MRVSLHPRSWQLLTEWVRRVDAEPDGESVDEVAQLGDFDGCLLA